MIVPGSAKMWIKIISARCCYALILLSGLATSVYAQPITRTRPITFDVFMEKPENQQFQVKMTMTAKGLTDLIMPVWTPGYYQKLDFAKHVSGFNVTDKAGKTVKWKKKDADTWAITSAAGEQLQISYNVTAKRAFVAESFLDTTRAYIIGGSMFMYPEGGIKQPSVITVHAKKEWKIATGLEPVSGMPNAFFSKDFDILYDAPILAGPLEEFPTVDVKGVPHRFIAYKPGSFDRQAFMNDIKKITTTAADLIGDIPFKAYTFIGIGPGQGGIEHLNSTTISFSGHGATPASRVGIYNFISHEYFHHYNAKRIRPIELGPFDYKKGSRTNMLWVAEGVNSYYDKLVVRRAGLSTPEEFLNVLRNNILAYESKPGRLYQSLVQASYNTWSDGPFGRTEDEVNRTISYYDKGPAVAMLMDMHIRHVTDNKRSLDDVMRRMYYEYYKRLGRGYTEKEFRMEAEKIAGTDMGELFDYTTTTKELDYQKYLNYAGMRIDTAMALQPNRYTGLRTRMRGDSLTVSSVDYQSPAWKSGIRARDVIVSLNQAKPTAQTLADLEKSSPAGTPVNIAYKSGGKDASATFKLEDKQERTFIMTRKENPTAKQNAIYRSWMGM